MVRLALVLGIASLATAGEVAPEPGVIATYARHAASGVTGQVTGRVWDEPRRSDASERPVAGIGVVLLPRTPWLVQRFHDVKEGSRGSVKAYTEATGELRRARDAVERAVQAAGASELVLRAASGPDGVYAFDRVPAGRWLLVAFRSVPGEPSQAPRGLTKRERGFAVPPRLVGYEAVMVWFRELTVVEGGKEVVDLTERNAWLAGVQEERVDPRK